MLKSIENIRDFTSRMKLLMDFPRNFGWNWRVKPIRGAVTFEFRLLLKRFELFDVLVICKVAWNGRLFV